MRKKFRGSSEIWAGVIYFLVFCGVSISVLGCGSTVKKADIPSTSNPTAEVAILETDVTAGYADHYDLLAADDFSAAEKYLKRANEGIRRNRSQSDILDDVRYAKAYLDRAREKAGQRRDNATAVLQARTEALQAGARNAPDLRDQLYKVDKRFRSLAEDFASNPSPAEFSSLQSSYLSLALAATMQTELGEARALINGARQAPLYAPQSLKKAQLDLKNAENMITSNRNNPEGYREAVNKANASARWLMDVLAVTTRPGGNIDEISAAKLVNQNRKIQSLQSQLGSAETTIDRQGSQLGSATAALTLQESIDRARREFAEEEAEVYQQGDKLVIRLKEMNFPIGRSDLPAQSISLLAKVKDIAGDLKPSSVIVEGHTDSVGSSEVNKGLSQARADAVAEYLRANGLVSDSIEAVGYGFKKPIASNKSKMGRAQNRRVDIVVIPSK